MQGETLDRRSPKNHTHRPLEQSNRLIKSESAQLLIVYSNVLQPLILEFGERLCRGWAPRRPGVLPLLPPLLLQEMPDPKASRSEMATGPRGRSKAIRMGTFLVPAGSV